jgi:hypothetical protein
VGVVDREYGHSPDAGHHHPDGRLRQAPGATSTNTARAMSRGHKNSCVIRVLTRDDRNLCDCCEPISYDPLNWSNAVVRGDT